MPGQLPEATNPGIKGARIYFSMGQDIQVLVNSDDTVAAPSPTDSSYFDFVEFALNDVPATPGNLNIDVSAVDAFGVPIQLQVSPPDSGALAGGVGANKSRQTIMADYGTYTSGTDFAKLLASGPDSEQPYRITSFSQLFKNYQGDAAGTPIMVQSTLGAPSPAPTTRSPCAIAWPDFPLQGRASTSRSRSKTR